MMQDKKEIPSLTGLRGVAALSILLSHYATFCNPVHPTLQSAVYPKGFLEAFAISDMGMSIFFVLSGFVIAYNYAQLQWRERPFYSLAAFLTFRFARLYPLLLCFIVIVVWTRPGFSLVQLQEKATQLDIFTALTASQSWFPYVSANGDMVIGGNFFFSWSISTEIFLYFTFAAMMLIGTRFFGDGLRIRYLLGYLAVALASMLFWSYQQTGIFMEMSEEQYKRWLYEASPYYRAIEFFLGMLACRICMYIDAKSSLPPLAEKLIRHSSALGVWVLVVIWAGNIVHMINPRHADVRLLMAAGVFCILLGARLENRVNAVLTSRALLFVGMVSYSLYFFHYIPPQFISHHVVVEPFNEMTTYRAIFILGVNYVFSLLFALAIAYGLYELVEVPSRRFVRNTFKRITKEKPATIMMAPVAATALAKEIRASS